MANKYMKITSGSDMILKTYTGKDPESLYEQLISYTAILQDSAFLIPKTSFELNNNTIKIFQQKVRGVVLSEWLTNKYDREVAQKYFNSLLDSIGSYFVTNDAKWLSEQHFCLDGSFSNFIVEEDTTRLYYVDLFPPRLVINYLCGKCRWYDLLVDLNVENQESEKYRFLFYDVRGIVLDSIIHLLYYLGSIGRFDDLSIIIRRCCEGRLIAKKLIQEVITVNKYDYIFQQYMEGKKVAQPLLRGCFEAWRGLRKVIAD